MMPGMKCTICTLAIARLSHQGTPMGTRYNSDGSSDRSKRRLDHIHVFDSLKGHLLTAFTCYLCRSDHKCVVVTCAPPVFHTQHPRFRCPDEFLHNHVVRQMTGQPEDLTGSPLENWESTHAILQTNAIQFSREHKQVDDPQVLPLLLNSTVQYVTPQGWKFVESRSLSPSTHAQAYSQLVGLHERDRSDKVGNLLLSKLKGLPAGDSITDVSQKERTKQIHKLMDELQPRKQLGWVRDKGGQVLADPVAIAQALEQHWSEVTTQGLATVEDCAAFLKLQLKLPPNFSVMARALFRPLSEALVADALDRLTSGSSPGQDGMPSMVYNTFHTFFIPLMTHHAFTIGQLPAGWELGLINCIPKASRLAAVSKLHPIALQDVKKKWIMNIVSLQIEQIFQQLTHSR